MDLQQIKARRKAVGLTQKELAQRANVFQSSISEIEAGKRRNPAWGTVERLLHALAEAEAQKTT